MKIGISACLIGKNCKYNGETNYSQKIIDFTKGHELVEICPEVMGGLPTPRTPAEKIGDRVIDKDGKDVTYEFHKGAKIALDKLKKEGVDLVILKSKSPSCSNKLIYDGRFSGNLISGKGVFASLLDEEDIKVIDSDHIIFE